MAFEKLPYHVIHYHRDDPRVAVGGVQTFALNLGLLFEKVDYWTPKTIDTEYVERNRVTVICDNQYTLDWPEHIPVIGFQHGVARVKAQATKSFTRRFMARKQEKAARRPNTLWAANSEWVADASRRLYGSPVEHVVYYPIDVDTFDGNLSNDGSRLILHDARQKHKGEALMKKIVPHFPDWSFELINRPHSVVHTRMAEARAFMHLSRYEGNSIVCNEAMAMDLPCMFTRVGLFQDPNGPEDIYLVDMEEMYENDDALFDEVGKFLDTLENRAYNPRDWVLANATMDIAVERWQAIMTDFERMSDWDLAKA